MPLQRLNGCESQNTEKPGRTPVVCDVTSLSGADRHPVECFIKDIYRRAHGADISVDYPILLSARDSNGGILAATGYRIASTGPLFLEQYTGEAAETVLARVYGRNVERVRIAEIGNLASTESGASLFLFAALTSCLERQGITHLMVTATGALRRRFVTSGLNMTWICDATADKLRCDGHMWGSYYASSPGVLAVPLADAIKCVKIARDERTPAAGKLKFTGPDGWCSGD